MLPPPLPLLLLLLGAATALPYPADPTPHRALGPGHAQPARPSPSGLRIDKSWGDGTPTTAAWRAGPLADFFVRDAVPEGEGYDAVPDTAGDAGTGDYAAAPVADDAWNAWDAAPAEADAPTTDAPTTDTWDPATEASDAAPDLAGDAGGQGSDGGSSSSYNPDSGDSSYDTQGSDGGSSDYIPASTDGSYDAGASPDSPAPGDSFLAGPPSDTTNPSPDLGSPALGTFQRLMYDIVWKFKHPAPKPKPTPKPTTLIMAPPGWALTASIARPTRPPAGLPGAPEPTPKTLAKSPFGGTWLRREEAEPTPATPSPEESGAAWAVDVPVDPSLPQADDATPSPEESGAAWAVDVPVDPSLPAEDNATPSPEEPPAWSEPPATPPDAEPVDQPVQDASVESVQAQAAALGAEVWPESSPEPSATPESEPAPAPPADSWQAASDTPAPPSDPLPDWASPDVAAPDIPAPAFEQEAVSAPDVTPAAADATPAADVTPAASVAPPDTSAPPTPVYATPESIPAPTSLDEQLPLGLGRPLIPARPDPTATAVPEWGADPNWNAHAGRVQTNGLDGCDFGGATLHAPQVLPWTRDNKGVPVGTDYRFLTSKGAACYAPPATPPSYADETEDVAEQLKHFDMVMHLKQGKLPGWMEAVADKASLKRPSTARPIWAE
ncbi:hypothetical protein Q8F55_005576 [Vanrija albida]|uniref:Uncharacterized protein n=1 Tax=Vanrija albida TaxID=181172 RepID=A0ABR3Q284_9TREE